MFQRIRPRERAQGREPCLQFLAVPTAAGGERLIPLPVAPPAAAFATRARCPREWSEVPSGVHLEVRIDKKGPGKLLLPASQTIYDDDPWCTPPRQDDEPLLSPRDAGGFFTSLSLICIGVVIGWFLHVILHAAWIGLQLLWRLVQ